MGDKLNCRKCAKCGRTRAEDVEVTYHRFPKPGTTNFTKAHAWGKYCWPNESWTAESLHKLHCSGKVLCGRHFSSSQFYDNKRTKLSRFAVPESDEVTSILNARENIFNQSREQEIAQNMSLDRGPLIEIKNMHNIPVNKLSSGSCSAINLPSHVDSKKSFTKKRGILSAINVSKLSEMAPREVELYNICRRKATEIVRLRKKLKNKKDIRHIFDDEVVQKLCNLKISNSFRIKFDASQNQHLLHLHQEIYNIKK